MAVLGIKAKNVKSMIMMMTITTMTMIIII